MIRISRTSGYFIGVTLTFIIYMVCQGLFLINTRSIEGKICAIIDEGGRYKFPYSYACFIPHGQQKEVKVRLGSNLDYDYEEPVLIFYKKNNPHKARVASFLTFWAIPFLPFVFVLIIVSGIVKGVFYKRDYITIQRKGFRFSVS